MKSMMKVFLKRILNGMVLLLSRMPGGQYIFEQMLNVAMCRTMRADHHGILMSFTAPNWLNLYRISTFSTKEPETLEWVESISEGAVLWDIGANIGLYSIYAARVRNCKVYAFEPSVFNLELLARNIFLNDLQNQITIVPIALSDQTGSSLFNMSNTAWGGALSSFGQDFDQNGGELNKVFEYQTLGISMTDAVALLKIQEPRYIKIDVDGIEHFILRGGADILSKADGVLLEINDDFAEQAEESARHLKNAGLTLLRKCNLGASNQYNQWWVRADNQFSQA